MMGIRLLYSLAFALLIANSFSQNLISNGGFDTITSCPNNSSQLYKAPPWLSSRGTCDLYNSCNAGLFGVPGNESGNQPARTGSGYAGFFATQGYWEVREYLYAPLKDSLVAGHQYCLSFYVALADSVDSWGDMIYDVAVNDIGAYFTSVAQTPQPSNLNHYAVTPQVVNPSGNPLTSRNTWTQVTGSFTALGGEKYIIIGSFSDMASQDTTWLDMWNFNNWAYYLIDDVSLIDCSAGLPLIASVSGINSICEGDSTILSASATGGVPGYSYSWSGLSNEPVQVVSPASTTVYTLTVTDTIGAIDTVIYTVNVLPIPISNAGNDTSICSGQSVTLIATGGGSYSWSNGSGNSSITVNPTDTMDYVVVVTVNGCSSQDTVTVNVIASPNVSAGSDHTICEGQDIILTVTGDGNYLWSNGAVTDSITVSPLVTTSYTVISSNGGCTASDSVKVFVSLQPTADAGSDTIICMGSTASLHASGGDDYLWSTGEIMENINVNPITDSIYYVKVSIGNCYAYDTVLVSVHVLPFLSISSDKDTICQLDTVGVFAMAINTSITWSSVPQYNFGSSVNSNSVDVTPYQSTIFVATANDGVCEVNDSIIIIVQNYSVLNLGVDQIICKGESVTIQSSPSQTLNWSNGSVAQNIVVSPVEETIYWATTQGVRCNSTDTILVDVVDPPVAYAGEDQSICAGSVIQLTGYGGGTYSWSFGSSDSVVTISPLVTSQYVLTVSNGACTDKDTVMINVIDSESSPCKTPESSIEIPNIFTPNGDGVNELLEIKYKEINEVRVEIYNRWGVLVKVIDTIDQYWDGTLKDGSLASAGTYFVLLQATGTDNIKYEKTFFIELIR